MSEFIHDEKGSNSDDKVNDMEKNDSTWEAPLLRVARPPPAENTM